MDQKMFEKHDCIYKFLFCVCINYCFKEGELTILYGAGYIYVNIWNQYAVHKTLLKSLKVNQ